jgi:hypothetical protein
VKLAPELPERPIPNHARPSPDGERANTIRPDTVTTGFPRRLSPALVKDLALSLGLPRDALSAALISLAKFFSLPLEAKILRQLRRQALSLPAPEPLSPGDARETIQAPPLAGRIRSAAFAAAAAAGKGVALSPEALGSYAAALARGLAPGGRDEAEDGPGAKGGTGTEGGADGDGGEQPEERPGSGPGAGLRAGIPGRPHDGRPPFDDRRALVEGIEGRLPLLGLLNRLPGRDGRRWISLPFSFRSGGVEYGVSLRIVLADTNSMPWKAERMALEVKAPGRRWSFMLENPAEREGRVFGRALFGAQPALDPGTEKGLRKLLGTMAGKVALRDISGGAFPEEEWGAGQWEP